MSNAHKEWIFSKKLCDSDEFLKEICYNKKYTGGLIPPIQTMGEEGQFAADPEQEAGPFGTCSE